MTTSNYPIRPLNITIVGAGIAGLTAAVALRKNGHLVQIFETSEIKTEIGAALGVQPNSLGVLNHLGVCRENLNGVPFLGNIIFDAKGGEGITRRWLVPGPNKNPGLLCHRSDLHAELKRLAIGVGEGVPAKLRLGTEVIECNPEEGSVTLNNGEVVYADIVLGADGINSVIRHNILGRNIRGSPSGWSCFRAVFETDTLAEIPELQWVTEGISGARSVVPKEGPFRMLFVYPCCDGNLINFVGFYTDSQEPVEVRKPIASREDIEAVFRDFDPKFLRLLDLPTHSEIHRWRMRVLPLLPTWINGRAALLGDAAHATLPLLGQGAAMAVEDAGALGCLFPAGTTRNDVQVRLEAYQNLRKDRGEFVNVNSVAQVSRIVNGGIPFARSQEMQSYLLEYDVIEAARKCYEESFGHGSAA
ncbi:FAD/NAD(P)-binding domain-containing protein [Mycena metata]|uniref:FAD/NAD(P)-binding domain-containing protein n=1 Tax=Mycena metata TaxID=1033252 RepID=A0AAD7JNG7_9AGAR|nr:FAD/NAD(P)-binding domain-containing protein [Mycena metata]